MSSVLDVNADNWEEEILQSKTLVLVEFWHEQCPWCKVLEPVYREVAQEYVSRVKFTRLNALSSQENQHIAFHHGVMSTPTLVFFCDGRPVGAVMGFQPKDRLRQLVNYVIANHRECVEKSTELKTA